MKKVVALVLAVMTVALMFTSCSKIGEDGKGAVIDVYMGTKTINLDPATAYTDENTVKLISLIFEGLVKLDENGKVKKALAKKWKVGEDRDGNTKMTVWIKNTYWSDGSQVQANDIVYAWKRILNPNFKSGAASMLYAIKGARDAKLGKIGIDDIGLYSLGTTKFEIVFESGADLDEFIYNMASPALVPLRENKVEPYADSWSYSSRDLSTNGPFRVKKFTGVSSDGLVDTSSEIILERSKFYYLKQDVNTEAADKYVTPYRIVLHFSDPLDLNYVSSSAETDVVSMLYENELFYASNLTAEAASDFKKSQLKYEPLASTYSYIFNMSNKAFANPATRYAMSVALDRNYAAEIVGAGAKAATGLIPSMIFNTDKGTSFRKKGGKVLSASDGFDAALDILDEAGVNPAAYDDIYLYYRSDETNDSYASASLGFYSKEKALATYVKSVWDKLGFYVVLKACNAQEYENVLKSGEYDVIGLDYHMLSAYPFYDLAPFATTFSGYVDMNAATDDDAYVALPGMSGYSNPEYDALIEEAYAETKASARAKKLHEAEEMLLRDGGIVPVVFNSDCYVISGKLSGVETNYFGAKVFTKTSLKNYENYLAILPKKELLFD
ncbi:MAG: hypothetical protein KBS59_03015 [Clostridiales bacterium]|nr:hypothetical protein [Clostridiales bacterium]